MSHLLQCRCGKLKGRVSRPEKGVRAVCYCRDCQAYAHFIDEGGSTLDGMGGTDVVATQSRYVSFTSGAEALACCSLTERGLLRWYASCCNTPIANTPRNFRLPYVGVVHTSLGSATEIECSFGPIRTRLNTHSAKGAVRSTKLSQLRALARLVPALMLARITGSYRNTPFFDIQRGVPVSTPKVLTPAERERAMSAV